MYKLRHVDRVQMLPVRTAGTHVWIARLDVLRRVPPTASLRPTPLRLKERDRRVKIRTCATSDGETSETPKLTQRVIEGGREARRNLNWSRATVIENKFSNFLQLVAHISAGLLLLMV